MKISITTSILSNKPTCSILKVSNIIANGRVITLREQNNTSVINSKISVSNIRQLIPDIEKIQTQLIVSNIKLNLLTDLDNTCISSKSIYNQLKVSTIKPQLTCSNTGLISTDSRYILDDSLDYITDDSGNRITYS